MKVDQLIRECEDEGLAEEYRADVAYVEGKTGVNVGKAEVKSQRVMGDAAGTCHIPSKDINFRADNFAANNARGFKQRRYTTGSFRHVARHEAEHALGNRLEGTTELVTSKELNVSPVLAYRKKVRAAKTMVDILGWDRTMNQARQENAHLLLFMDLFRHKIAANTPFTTAVEESVELVQEAA